MDIRIKLKEGGKMPTRATDGAVAFDVYVPIKTQIRYGRQIVPLGFSIELPLGYEAKIEPRSGFSSKGMEDELGRRMDADVLVGKIDWDYRGEVGAIIKRYDTFNLAEGTRIAQMTIYKVETPAFVVVDDMSETERSESGFGSTGR